MNKKAKRLRAPLSLVVAVVLAAIPEARATLEWTSKSFRGDAAPLQKTMTVAFAFKNTGTTPVNIRDLQTNCDCLEAAADKATYQPGEAGVVTATFTVGERYGTYQRTVTLVTDDEASPHRLAVRIEVPEAATFVPRTLNWKIGGEAREQSTDLMVATTIALEFSGVIASNGNFRARLETVEAGRHYRLHVTPASTANAANGALRVRGKSSSGDEVVISAYANVR